MRGHAIAKVQGGQQRGAEAARHAPVHQRDRRVDGGDRTQPAEQAQPRPIAAQRAASANSGEARRTAATTATGADIAADADRPAQRVQARCAGGGRKPIAASNAGAPSAEKMIARITVAVFLHARCPRMWLLRGQDGAACDLESPCGPRRAPVPRWRCGRDCASGNPCRETVARCGEHVVHQADALEQLGPIDVGDQAHAGDDVAHRDGRGALPLVFVAHDRVGCRSLRRQMLVEPRQRGRDPRILVAQPVHELDGECVRQRRAVGSSASTTDAGSAVRPPAPSKRSARSSASCRAALLCTIRSARRLRFSTSTIRSVIATAQSSPIVSGCTSW